MKAIRSISIFFVCLLFTIQLYGLSVSQSQSYSYSQLSSAISSATTYKIFAQKESNSGLSRTNTDSKLRIYLNLGSDYLFGTNTVTSSIKLTIKPYKVPTSGSAVSYATYTTDGSAGKVITLSLSSASPEIIYELDVDDWFSSNPSKQADVNMLYITPSSLSVNANVQLYFTLKLTHEIQYTLDVSNLSTTISQISTASSQQLFSWVSSYTAPSTIDAMGKITYSVPAAITDVPYWQFQLLRLYNTSENTNSDERTITSQKIDWNDALNLFLDKNDTFSTTISGVKTIYSYLKLTIGEGSGYYAWRVRPVGNVYEGGIANSRNYGKWSTTTSASQLFFGSASVPSYCFWYTDNDSYNDINWIYSRTFSEGDASTSIKQYETKTYANNLGMVKQSQAINRSENFVVANQTVYDYTANAALQSMPVPLTNRTSFEYQAYLLRHSGNIYTASDFAADATYRSPNAINDTTSSGQFYSYYSDFNTDKTIPSAQGYPFSYVLYKNDGSGRIKESSGVGKYLKMGSGKTPSISYGKADDTELIKLFGDEAPNADDIFKTTSYDENHNKTETFTNKNKQTIAVCRDDDIYTIFYYDRAGNLVRSVEPKGVGTSCTSRLTSHPYLTYVTEYDYDFAGNVIRKKTPDGGETNYIYDSYNRLRFSQNEKQKANAKYAYVKYDEFGRTIETGEVSNDYANDISSMPQSYTDNIKNPSYGNVNHSTITYSKACSYLASSNSQKYLRNRISYVKNEDNSYIAYSYDAHGNVAKLYVHNAAMEYNTSDVRIIEYEYDLISNLLTKIKYNTGQVDQFFKKLTYDANARLTKVETSVDDKIYDADASYSYYKHGPLKRVETGEDKIQGVDYVYTLQGWLKGINHTSLDATIDPGADNGSNFATDIFSSMLNYYSGDFYKNNSSYNSNNSNKYCLLPSTGSSTANSQYNGNIASEVSKLADKSMSYKDAWGYQYTYDDFNRLTNANFYKYSGSAFASNTDYKMAISYDDNGNIKTLLRNGYSASKTDMDNLTYNYKSWSNKINYIKDDKLSSNYTVDIDAQASGNYSYDEIGNLSMDKGNNVNSITWNVWNKPVKVTKSSGETIEFTYDAMGNRISKKSTSGSTIAYTYYILDAKGNTVAAYDESASTANTNKTLSLKEIPITASSRIGTYKPSGITVRTIANGVITNKTLTTSNENKRKIGYKQYEITDHLGNVRATFSDIKLSTLSTAKVPCSFTADISSLSNYYPYGMQMAGNTYNTTNSRYGFQGKEKDNEILGEGNEYDFGARLYDPRVGRWLSMDPLAEKFADESPYTAMGNDPVNNIDPDGKAWGDAAMVLGAWTWKTLTGEEVDLSTVSGRIRGLVTAAATGAIIWGSAGVVVEAYPALVGGLTAESMGGVGITAGTELVATGGGALTGVDLAPGIHAGSSSESGSKTIVQQGEGTLATVERVDPALANARHTNPAKGWDSPYLADGEVYDITLKNEATFPRGTEPGNPSGSTLTGAWLADPAEVAGKSGVELQQGLALNSAPTHLVTVKVPAGATLRTGTAAPRPSVSAPGGMTQYELPNGQKGAGATPGTPQPIK